jgi:hypothetical protein
LRGVNVQNDGIKQPDKRHPEQQPKDSIQHHNIVVLTTVK